jgi:hypothetical protein
MALPCGRRAPCIRPLCAVLQRSSGRSYTEPTACVALCRWARPGRGQPVSSARRTPARESTGGVGERRSRVRFRGQRVRGARRSAPARRTASSAEWIAGPRRFDFVVSRREERRVRCSWSAEDSVDSAAGRQTTATMGSWRGPAVVARWPEHRDRNGVRFVGPVARDRGHRSSPALCADDRKEGRPNVRLWAALVAKGRRPSVHYEHSRCSVGESRFRACARPRGPSCARIRTRLVAGGQPSCSRAT